MGTPRSSSESHDDRPSFTGVTWHRTPCNGGACVRVARQGRWVAIGDSKDLDGEALIIPLPAWDELVGALKTGTLRRP